MAGDAGDERLDRWQYPLDNDGHARGIGVDTIRLVEIGSGGDPVEEERVKQRPIFPSQVGIDGVECLAVFGTEVRRSQHAGKKHRQSVLSEPGDELVERVTRDLRVYAAQRIIGAEFDDHGVGVVAHRPVDPREAVARRVARNASVDDDHVVAVRLECLFELGRERGCGVEAISCRQAVAEGDDADRIGCRRCRQCDGKDEDRRKRLDRHLHSTI